MNPDAPKDTSQTTSLSGQGSASDAAAGTPGMSPGLSGSTVTIQIPREYLSMAAQFTAGLAQSLAHAEQMIQQQEAQQTPDANTNPALRGAGPGAQNPNKISPADQQSLVRDLEGMR